MALSVLFRASSVYVQNKNEDIVFINLSLNNMIDQLLLSLINTAD